jgi:hypothetical protein
MHFMSNMGTAIDVAPTRVDHESVYDCSTGPIREYPVKIEKIHDIPKHLGADGMNQQGDPSRKQVGVINLRFIRCLAFLVISGSVIACAVLGVMAVWEAVPIDFAWKSLVSLGIIAFTMAIFVSLNEGFGPAVRGQVIKTANEGAKP